VTSLAMDREGRTTGGSEPNGILYRVSGKDKAFVLYDANLPEIRSIVTAADGFHLRSPRAWGLGFEALASRRAGRARGLAQVVVGRRRSPRSQ